MQSCGHGGEILSSHGPASVSGGLVGRGLRTGAFAHVPAPLHGSSSLPCICGCLGWERISYPPSVVAEIFFVSVQDSGPKSFLSFHQGRWISLLPFPRISGSLLRSWKWEGLLLFSQWFKAFASCETTFWIVGGGSCLCPTSTLQSLTLPIILLTNTY